GLAVAVPDDGRGVVAGALTGGVQALVAVDHQLLAGGVGEPLVGATPAVVDLQLGAVGGARIGHVQATPGPAAHDLLAATAATAATATAGAADGDVGIAAALVALGGQDHVVEAAEVHAVAGPGVEVVAGGDGPS